MYYIASVLRLFDPKINIMSRKSITFADKQDEWLKLVVKQGHYKDESDYIRDLVRRDEEKNRKFLLTKVALQEGLDSGISKKSLDEIWSQAQSELQGNL